MMGDEVFGQNQAFWTSRSRMRQRMYCVKAREVVELVAELILDQKHSCGPDCLCWKLRRVPAINEAIGKLNVQKLQGKANLPKGS
jgi:hypothetical protein